MLLRTTGKVASWVEKARYTPTVATLTLPGLVCKARGVEQMLLRCLVLSLGVQRRMLEPGLSAGNLGFSED